MDEIHSVFHEKSKLPSCPQHPYHIDYKQKWISGHSRPIAWQSNNLDPYMACLLQQLLPGQI